MCYDGLFDQKTTEQTMASFFYAFSSAARVLNGVLSVLVLPFGSHRTSSPSFFFSKSTLTFGFLAFLSFLLGLSLFHTNPTLFILSFYFGPIPFKENNILSSDKEAKKQSAVGTTTKRINEHTVFLYHDQH